MTNNTIITIAGPSGSGKTILSKLLCEEKGMYNMVSTTTRQPRQGEEHGKDYFFVTKEEFLKDLEANKFIENVDYNGNLYGVSVQEVLKAFEADRPAVVVAEPHGVEQILNRSREENWNCLTVFVNNPADLLVGRLFNRFLIDVGHAGVNDEDVTKFSPWIEKALLLSETEMPVEDMKKLLTDFAHHYEIDLSNQDKQVNAAANRLKMFYYEQEHWVTPTRSPETNLFVYITEEFNQQVQQDVIENVVGHVETLKKNAEQNTNFENNSKKKGTFSL